MANRLARTFGIEFEFVLAFHESELKRILRGTRSVVNARIVKKDPLRHKLLDSRMPSNQRTRWPSWALEVPASDAAYNYAYLKLGFVTDSGNVLRRYLLEPLLIAKDTLNTAGCKVNVVGISWAARYGVPTTHFESTPGGDICVSRTGADYTQWTLTDDGSLIGATKGELRAALPGVVNVENQDDWDSHGIELVTRIFDYEVKPAALREIQRYLSALHYGNMTPSSSPTNLKFSLDTRISTVPSVFAGTHVHVGFSGGEGADVPLKVLQHLAYMLLTHEELISGLHPKHRSGLITEPQFELSSVSVAQSQQSDTLPLGSVLTEEQKVTKEGRCERAEQHREEQRVRALTRSYIAAKEVQSNFKFFCDKVFQSERPTLRMIREKIFEKDMTEERLIGLMNVALGGGTYSRGYIVNWSNLLGASGKKTIEFRQHGCTLCVPELNQWIDFLFACVFTAERLADIAVALTPDPDFTYAEREGSKYSEADDYHISTTVADMCGPKLLGLQDEQIQYWMKRYDRYEQEKALYRPTVETRLARLEKARLAKTEEAAAQEGWQEFDAMHAGES